MPCIFSNIPTDCFRAWGPLYFTVVFHLSSLVYFGRKERWALSPKVQLIWGGETGVFGHWTQSLTHTMQVISYWTITLALFSLFILWQGYIKSPEWNSSHPVAQAGLKLMSRRLLSSRSHRHTWQWLRIWSPAISLPKVSSSRDG